MNQAVLQTLNQLLTPLQLLMILVYVRLGEWLWSAQDARFTLADMLRTFREQTFANFLNRFGWAGVHAASAWALTTPLLIAALYFALRPTLRRLAALRVAPATPPAVAP